MNRQPNYQFYATLLDAFAGYINSSIIYQEYWGFSENPGKTEQDFEAEQFQSLIDRINRVPFDSEAADRGTAFNEIVDCMILGCQSEKMQIERVYQEIVGHQDTGVETKPMLVPVGHTTEVVALKATYNNRTFTFPISLCREFADYYKGATPQVLTSANLKTMYGTVRLYGYIDELMPTSVHDIKTTGKYSVGKFRHNWQHLVYPYCLIASGCPIYDFEYNVAEFPKYGEIKTYTESYRFDPEQDTDRLTQHCEQLIEFLEANRHLITDTRIFGG